MNILKRIYKYIYHVIQQQKWYTEAVVAKMHRPNLNCLTEFPKGRNLILIPHVDDEWIGVSRILTLGCEVLLVYMNMPGEDTIAVHAERERELRRLCTIMNLDLSILHGDNKHEELRDLIIEYHPTHVFLPFFIDWHSQHIEVMRILKSSLDSMSRNNLPHYIVCYQVSVPIPDNYVTHVLTMNKKEWKDKWKHFKKYYPTQIHIPTMRFAYQEFVNGGFCNSFSAEAYAMMPTEKWLNQFDVIIPSTEFLTQIKTSINDIKIIRSLVQQ